MVRAKYVYAGSQSSEQTVRKDPKGDFSPENVEKKEMRTLIFSPVHAVEAVDGEVDAHDVVRLATVEPSVWEQFKPGHRVYIDFTHIPEEDSAE